MIFRVIKLNASQGTLQVPNISPSTWWPGKTAGQNRVLREGDLIVIDDPLEARYFHKLYLEKFGVVEIAKENFFLMTDGVLTDFQLLTEDYDSSLAYEDEDLVEGTTTDNRNYLLSTEDGDWIEMTGFLS